MHDLFLREVAKEIMDNAFDEWFFNKDAKQYMGAFDEDECFRILQKHFPKGAKNTEQQVQPDNADKEIPFGYYPNNEFE
jgi:hypothetical protein